jgi:hypothetical protein
MSRAQRDELLKAKKASEDEESEDEGTDEGDSEEEDMEESTDLSEDDLEKSLDRLQQLVDAEDPTSRKQFLLEKAQRETLEKSEQKELFDLLGQGEAEKESFGEEVTKGLDENNTLQKALDVSDFLQEQHAELVKSLGMLAEYQEKSDARQHAFNLILAKAVADEGRLIKGIAERLSVIEEQPAREPKSKGVRPLEKSFAGSQPPAEQLGKSETLNALMGMLEESMQKGGDGVTEDGIDLAKAVTKCELFGTVEPRLAAKIRERRNGAMTH